MAYQDYLKKDFTQLIESLELTEQQKHFMRSRWLDQILWMEGKASQCKKRHHQLKVLTIVGSSVVPILVSLQDEVYFFKHTAIGIGGLVAIASAIEQFFKWGDKWHHYRKTSESLKAQGWLLSQSLAHQEAFDSFRLATEDILARDVELFVTQVSEPKKD